MTRTNVLLGVLLAAFGGWYLWLTTGATRRSLPHDPGLVFMPRVLAGALILLAALLILQQLVPRLPRPRETPPPRLDGHQWLQTVGLVGLTVVYVGLLPALGFLVATPAYLVAAGLLYGVPWRTRRALVAAAVTGVVYVAFVHIFRVALPPVPLP